MNVQEASFRKSDASEPILLDRGISFVERTATVDAVAAAVATTSTRRGRFPREANRRRPSSASFARRPDSRSRSAASAPIYEHHRDVLHTRPLGSSAG